MEFRDLITQEKVEAEVEKIAQELIRGGLTREDSTRFLLGIIGIPAAGKSAFAIMLAATINGLVGKKVAVVIPMDGFHLPNDILEKRGLLTVKGAPETFDAEGFVELLQRLREDRLEKIWGPIYDRKLHAPVNNAIEVDHSIRIIIAEGNYLLMNTPPWNKVRGLLDKVWYLDTPREVTIKRLMQRHLASGRSEQEAIEKIENTDLPNSYLIEEARSRADRIIRLEADS